MKLEIHINKSFMIKFNEKIYYGEVVKDYGDSSYIKLKIWEEKPFYIFSKQFIRKKRITNDATFYGQRMPVRYNTHFDSKMIGRICEDALKYHFSGDDTTHQKIINLDS